MHHSVLLLVMKWLCYCRYVLLDERLQIVSTLLPMRAINPREPLLSQEVLTDVFFTFKQEELTTFERNSLGGSQSTISSISFFIFNTFAIAFVRHFLFLDIPKETEKV